MIWARVGCVGVLATIGGCGGDGTGVLLDAPRLDAAIDAVVDAPVDSAPVQLDCDLVTQDCGPGERCTAIANPDAAHPRRVARCEPDGSVGQDGACTRDEILLDNCSKGLYCTPSGFCRPLCGVTPDCGGSEACLVLNPTTGPGYDVAGGVCEPSCGGLDDTSCPTGFTCDLGYAPSSTPFAQWHCRRIGTVPVGQFCGINDLCGARSSCGFTCMEMCDATHPCTNGGACSTMVDMVPVGFCM